ncbi:hypothetical protein GYB70_07070 [Sinorhizobium meliloti]|jgi:hypothetical protein|nr:hypothetical protein DU99_05190 [Sinorhizobium meliloti]MDW9361358.1 hypothetical protein [Sinorhizobium meliloti]
MDDGASPRPHLCACHRDEGSAASAAREAFFQPKDLVWLDPCDEHSIPLESITFMILGRPDLAKIIVI